MESDNDDSGSLSPKKMVLEQIGSSEYAETCHKFQKITQGLRQAVGDFTIAGERKKIQLLMKKIEEEKKLSSRMNDIIRKLDEKNKVPEERKNQDKQFTDKEYDETAEQKNALVEKVLKIIDNMEHDCGIKAKMNSYYGPNINGGAEGEIETDEYTVAFLNSDKETEGSIRLKYRSEFAYFDVVDVSVHPSVNVTGLLDDYNNTRYMRELLYAIGYLVLQHTKATNKNAISPEKV